MSLEQYLDATYLKTAAQAGISKKENIRIVEQNIQEAIQYDFKLIMIRPEFVSLAKTMIVEAKSKLSVGTVIDFPKGDNATEFKVIEAKKAILDGADELDFVLDYEAFKRGEITMIKEQVLICTKLALESNKVVKWIIEVAALSHHQIIQLCVLIKNVIIANFKESFYDYVFVKSSTGFYQTQEGLPNGATVETVKIMLENAFPLPVKAAGGVRNYEEAVEMIKLGVKRIGTSAAKAIVEGKESNSEY
ncbi:deoxyribose-phosphate aldolase [Flavobacterium sp. TP390]|uniref:Deoxyribose-phosphate aldolase n=1 Tax=Flavobacterium profundi TaxID=1774945 RepID=A0A6I4IGY5_9FLAO|nr:deoxyribose-phosphate aldolase [Flavobacterium profundi]MVO08834.1 deoxyribose-phosphate aldolase [Flavobacterium profundi]